MAAEPGAHQPSRRLAKNTLWNFVGLLAPLPVGIVVIPFLTHRLGADRFGVLTMTWAVLGYFSVFDLGLGRAVIKFAAQAGASGEGERSWGAVFGTSLALLLGLGVLGGGAVALGSAWVASGGMRIPDALRGEAQTAFLLLALSMPPMIVASAPMGLLAASGRFDVLNLIRLPLTVFLFVGPAAVALLTVRLPAVVGVMVASRYVALALNLWFCGRVSPGLWRRLHFDRALVRPLLGFGGWLTLIQVVSPLMVNLDRLLVGALVSSAAVTYYATPSEALTRLWGVPSAVVGVLFPAFAATFLVDRKQAAALYERGVKFIYVLLLPVLLAAVLFAPEALGAWLGGDFPARSTLVMQLVAVGVFVYSLNHVPAEMINAAGRPSFTARARVVELVAFLPLAWLLITRLGIRGAAIAWLLRVVVDTGVLFAGSHRLLGSPRASGRRILAAATLGLGAMLVGCLPAPLALRLGYFVLVCTLMTYTVFNFWLDAAERASIGDGIRRVLRWQSAS